jgi:putative addiction module component (TIGR02574 family)
MTHEAQELLERALKLPPEVRADLATRIFESLEDDDGHDPVEAEKAWRDEIVRRVRRVVETGEPGIPFEQVDAELGELLARKRAARGEP